MLSLNLLLFISAVKRSRPGSRCPPLLPSTCSSSVSPSFGGARLHLDFGISAGSIYRPVSVSDFFRFWPRTFCQLTPPPLPLSWAFSGECWIPAQGQVWNTGFPPGSAGRMLLCQFLSGFVLLCWPAVPVPSEAVCRRPTAPWLAFLCSSILCDCPFGLEVLCKKSATALIFGCWGKSLKSINVKKNYIL